jgi:transglutaminase-like putative cysteine protease
VLHTPDPMASYLAPSTYIDFTHPEIQDLVASFTAPHTEEESLARAMFEWVRDAVAHSWDIQGTRVTVKASEVLHYREGICYAKSHLLAALLRGAGIPAGLCYQRLTRFDDPSDGMVVHALNALYLREQQRWIRVDARGNKPGVDAQFSVDQERLAFPIRPEYGELDYPINYSQPHPLLVATLEQHDDARVMYLTGLPSELPELQSV